VLLGVVFCLDFDLFFLFSSLCLLLSVFSLFIYLFIYLWVLTINNNLFFALRFFIYLCLNYDFLKGEMGMLDIVFVCCGILSSCAFWEILFLFRTDLQTDCCCVVREKNHNNQSVCRSIHHHRSQGKSVSNLILWFLTRYQWCEISTFLLLFLLEIKVCFEMKHVRHTTYWQEKTKFDFCWPCWYCV
jgi:hypothetical protein